MTTRIAATEQPSEATAAPDAAARVVLWLELPKSAIKAGATGAAREVARETCYDPAALYEEPERWDGMA